MEKDYMVSIMYLDVKRLCSWYVSRCSCRCQGAMVQSYGLTTSLKEKCPIFMMQELIVRGSGV